VSASLRIRRFRFPTRKTTTFHHGKSMLKADAARPYLGTLGGNRDDLPELRSRPASLPDRRADLSGETQMKHDGFDEVIHAPNRLKVCAYLSSTAEVEFSTLRDLLEVSDSALS